MQTNDLLCKDCKHSFIPWTDRFSLADVRYTMKCRLAYKPEDVDKNYVTGHKPKPAHYESCSLSRISSRGDGCGEQGRHWAPKHKNGLFKLIAKEHRA
jgi:hypothetical protein